MVNYRSEPLDRVFAALADPTRRALVARLGGVHSLSVSELKRPFDVSLPAIMKHLDVLAEAGLIARNKTGRTVAPADRATDGTGETLARSVRTLLDGAARSS